MYHVEYASGRIIEDLKKYYPQSANQIIMEIEGILKNFSFKTRGIETFSKTRSSTKRFRLRTGDIRAIFEVDKKDEVIRIVAIKPRKEVYKKK